MPRTPKKKIIKTMMPDSEPFEGPAELLQKDRLLQMQSEVAGTYDARLIDKPRQIAQLLQGFLEIADFMLKNTCGAGSSYQLADCEIDKITREDIDRYYQLLLTLLVFHFGQLVPNLSSAVKATLLELVQDLELCGQFIRELETCLELETREFSPVQAGHKLWDRVAKLLHVKPTKKSLTGRIYYQTAPGQNLIYIVEQASQEGWIKTE